MKHEAAGHRASRNYVAKQTRKVSTSFATLTAEATARKQRSQRGGSVAIDLVQQRWLCAPPPEMQGSQLQTPHQLHSKQARTRALEQLDHASTCTTSSLHRCLSLQPPSQNMKLRLELPTIMPLPAIPQLLKVQCTQDEGKWSQHLVASILLPEGPRWGAAGCDSTSYG